MAVMRMAKASKSDMEKLLVFMRTIEHLTETDVRHEKIGRIVARMFPKMCQGYRRVIWGCDILIDNCCDPALSYLEFKPELIELMRKSSAIEKEAVQCSASDC